MVMRLIKVMEETLDLQFALNSKLPARNPNSFDSNYSIEEKYRPSPSSKTMTSKFSTSFITDHESSSSLSQSSSSKTMSGMESTSQKDEETFGFFDIAQESEHQIHEEDRSAWATVASTVSSKYRRNNEPVLVLNEWYNPLPSMSMKISSSDISQPPSFGVSVSCCISGLRICQYTSGVVKAEYKFVFCYGSICYSTWKPYSEFKKLADIVTVIHNKDPKQSVFHHTLKEWHFLEEKKHWFRCLHVKYLLEKSVLIGKFMEALLHDSPSPGLLIAFAQENKLQSLPSC